MDLVYVEDVARANLLVATTPVTDEAINIGTGKETTLEELAAQLLRAMGSSLKPTYGPAPRVNAVARRRADIRRAQDLLGFEPAVDLVEGLRRTVAWWRRERPAHAHVTS
jgi:UDP-glucose 4-epimerase